MDLTNTGTGGSAVACPVCTLYLREGISLQRHLDTHPKEQVIEALIKASTTSLQTHPMQLSPSGSLTSSSIQSPPNAAPVTQATHLSNQSPYPIGPIFECPPISAVIPPQFTSFSYQQFVNNGTMMVPQYAMAPQTNQMMHMLYNPYGMYQQQQMPAVQMISPVSSVPNTSRIRPIGAMHSETNGRTAIAVSVNSSEPKQILPEILPEPEVEAEAEQVLPDINLPVTPLSSSEDTSIRRDESGTPNIRLEHDRQSSHNSNVENQRTLEHDYDNIPRPFGLTCNVNVAETDDKVESVLPDIEDVESTQVITTNVQCKSIQYELTEGEVYTSEYDNGNSDLSCNEIPTMINRSEQKRANAIGVHCSVEVNKNVTVSSQHTPADSGKDSGQPEVEQLEHLLITIMESELNNASQKELNFAENHERSDKQIFASNRVENINHTDADTASMHEDNYESSNIEIEISEKLITHSDIDHESNFKCSYHYKHSLSAPASPVMHKRTDRSSSVYSKFCSTENLHNYQTGQKSSIIQDQRESIESFDEKNEEEDIQEKNEENIGDKDEVEDNFNEADMELEQLHSPHTPFIKHGETTDHMRSHTPLSTCSGISVLRVRKDLSKPCSPASMRSFCHMDANDFSHDEDSNNAADVSTENDPINFSSSDQDIKTNGQEISILDNIENKVIMSPTYHQSVITEHGSPFPTIHSQQTVSIYEAYPLQNSKTRGILNLSESLSATDNTGSKIFHSSKSVVQKPSMELLSLNEDAHAGPMNVFEFDGLQILVPSTFISDSSQKAVSATSQLSAASSEGGVGVDEEVKSVNMRADETMPARGELSEQESNGCTEQSAWQLYVGQESSRMSTSYDLMARESWEESEGSDNEIGGPLLDSRSLATHFTSSLFLDRDRKTPTNRMFKCYHCSEIFDCPKERRVHSTTVHREVEPSSSKDPVEQPEVKDIKLLDGRMNVFEDIFVPSLHVQQVYHHQQPLLHQLQPPQSSQLNKIDPDHKIEKLVISSSIEITCALCNQRFNSERSLQLHHRRMHDAEVSRRIRESTKCQICNEQFPSVLSFNAHLKIHPLECAQCGKYFYRKQNFKLHMKRHLGIKPFPCTVCDKAFLTKQKLDEHTNGHTGNAPVKCNLCNETFRRYSNLTQHKNRHHLNIKKKLKDYICHCGEVFHTKKKLAWHKETHDDKPKACTYCNERFIHMASLTRHMRRAHNRRFVPDAQRDNENVECPICKCIYLRSSLAVHMRVHNGEKPYECQVCSKAFSTKWNLQLHRWTHAARSTKPFKCNQCSAAFYRHSDYIAHMNSHRNVRPYTCNYCGAQFIRKYNCLRHVKEHEENKAYTCDVCNKAFHRSYYLKEHLRVHSGARPYTCHICGKSSGTKSNHNKHVRIHHAREPVNTEN